MDTYESIFESIIPQTNISGWWAKKRLKYNLGLVVSDIIAFIAYATILSIKSSNDVNNMDTDKYEITLFTSLFQGIGYLMMIGIANLFYFLGPLFDKVFNKKGTEKFRNRLFNIGFYFSCALPFTIPILVLIFV